ncbi:ETC complex I subunit conserved region-domain-containing protein [Xylaria bambusicola]|uniref:ETC complex I subunit conserved region-domain-containing protein n=1 Tax=Xylaria bambusicola TaxID=326684 RepID=UPI002007EBFD|nr:ETC complex I subunit conserved region-domain-containing protein [Xylaria bambusicola]KAI0505772.1 ETC complex I subunit conserved region-domain-containing protein [Xylaria bambusicola]
MRRTLRLLADIKPARYLEAGNPTGLTGLYTHSSPRSSLLFLYSHTLDKLQKFPESSLYRKSVEAQTKHRMSIVEAAVPPGYQEWAERAQKTVKENPGQFSISTSAKIDGARAITAVSGGSVFVHRTDPQPQDIRYEEWDGERITEGDEGLRGPEEREDPRLSAVYDRKPLESPDKVEWEAEPQMTADQVEEIENKIGAGLIEEVVQMAESELKLIDIMYEAKVWESLEEKPPAGQWEYFERVAP